MKRVRLRFAKGLEVEFTDRQQAVRQIEEIGERGTYPVYLVYGPEGCGKTALLLQARSILEEDFGYHVVYVNPLAEERDKTLLYTPTISDIVREVLGALPDPYSRIVDAAIAIASSVLKRFRKPRLALLMDDVFQAVGVDKAERYVKILLNLIEYPPGDYERIVTLVTSSEGVTRERVGRHSWADMFILWNMPRMGFRELYDAIPGGKPPFEDVWRWAGGNPRLLAKLYEIDWSVERVVDSIVRGKRLEHLVASLGNRELEILAETVNDPDALFKRLREPEAQSLERKLIENNLVIEVWSRDGHGWIDTPPPEKDPELGIGRYIAWQTPLHRETVRRALARVGVREAA